MEQKTILRQARRLSSVFRGTIFSASGERPSEAKPYAEMVARRLLDEARMSLLLILV